MLTSLIDMETRTMKSNKKITCSIFLLIIGLLQSCTTDQNPEELYVHPDLTEILQSDSVARRFQESSTQGPTVVESAIELSEKYARLSDEASVLRQQNKDLVAQNKQFKEQVIAIEKQLQQTQKELSEANEILIEMRIELNNWKSDVLGFRNEMRNAETAQLEALLKILQVLGGEYKAETAQGKTLDSTLASLNPSG
jgi:chromosome segregation ATPase